MDPDVVEIPPPIHQPSSLRKQKRAILYDVIDVDDDDNDDEDLMIIGEKVCKSNKVKKIGTFHDGYVDHRDVHSKANIGSVSGIESSSGYPAVSNNLFNIHGHVSGLLLEPPDLGKFKSAKKAADNSYHLNFVGYDVSLHPSGIESKIPWLKNFISFEPSFTSQLANPVHYPFDPVHVPPVHAFDDVQVRNSARNGKNGTSVVNPVVTVNDEVREEIMRKFQSFKKFDTVEDFSDHHFVGNSAKLNAKNWAKKIQEEWKILEKDLPDSIFVRVCESRIDLLRAVIIGAEGTPYHDGLFFFDVFFPITYPKVPPKVHYHSGGLRLNPNLYHCGKVCLSLLGTWHGRENEKWLPGVSTILQVLVSIQGLILNAKPYYNEPGYEYMSGSASGEKKSLEYNEDTFILSLRTMMYMIRRPPKSFEDFIVGHFYHRAPDILLACKAYMEGAQVASLVKGGVQDVDESNGSCSKRFKESLKGYVDMLVKEFAQIGAKDTGKFLSPAATTRNKPSCEFPWLQFEHSFGKPNVEA